jgi:FAD/FMN-containing dehydrogenase
VFGGLASPLASGAILSLSDPKGETMATTIETLQGTVATVDPEALEQLRMSIRGDVLTPDDPGYASVRPAYNAMHPGSPGLAIRATGASDVIAAVNFAREHNLLVAVRGGGHSVAGLSSIDGGMLIDLEQLDGVEVDLEAQVVRVQGGALVGDLDHETLPHGLVSPNGVVSDTGVAGLTLGGGEGWVRRKYGLAIDNLVSAQVVTADGRLITASEDSNADLFWALRGGGGNFGIVTSFTYKLRPLGPMVAFGGVFYDPADAPQIYRAYRDWARQAPNEISSLIGCTTLPASEHTPPEIHNRPIIVCGAVYAGDSEEGMKVIQPIRGFGTPIADISDVLPYVGVQAAFDEFFVRGTLRSYWKSTFVEELTDDVLDIVVEKAQNRPSDRTFVVTFLMGGAINDVGPEDTAYSERSANWMLSFDGNWEDPAEDDKVISWVRGAWQQAHEKGTGSVYLNFTSLVDEGTDTGVQTAFGRNLERLREIKATYDPQNFFRLNNNIPPA